MQTLRVIGTLHEDRAMRERITRLFEDRYSELLQWALQITDRDASAAEELVHDLYVDFILSRTDLSGATNLNGYLYRALKNMNSSRIRRAWKHEHQDLSVVDFDSMAQRLRARRSAEQVEVQEQLRKLCAYLCVRKESTKSASVLLLRYFRAYLPEEIMRLAVLSRAAVDTSMRTSRDEARRYLSRPFAPLPAGSPQMAQVQGERVAVELDNLVRWIGKILDEARSGECFTGETLESFYGSLPCMKPDTAQLSHLVSCEICLEAASRRLGMEPPSDRSPLDGRGPTRDDVLERLHYAQMAADELFEHDPSQLQLAVNGEDVLTWQVSSPTTRQIITLDPTLKIEFVEVFSRIGLRLLKIDVTTEPPDGPPEITQTVMLSGQRLLTVSIEWYGHDPRIRVQYEVPAASSVVGIHEVTGELHEPEAALADETDHTLTKWPSDSIWKRLRRAFWKRNTMIAVFGVIGSIVFFFMLRAFKHRTSNAEIIIQQSIASEAASEKAGIGSHRILDFDVLNDRGETIQSGRVEVWRAGQKVAKRLYSSDGKLLAGAWQDGNGSSIHLRAGHLETSEQNGSCNLATEVWACDLSARTFERLANGKRRIAARQEGSDYVVTSDGISDGAEGIAEPRLVRAVLVIARNSMRAKESDLWVSDHGTLHRYRYVETDYERQPDLDSNSSVFRPDKPMRSSRLSGSSAPGTSVARQSAALVHLHLQVLMHLHAVGADVGEPIDILHTSQGNLLVTGVLPDVRAREVRQAMADLAHNPLVRVKIRSVSDLARDRVRRHTTPISIDSIEIEPTDSPDAKVLKEHFRMLGYSGEQLDEQTKLYTESVLTQSARALQQAWSLHELSQLATNGTHRIAAEDEDDYFILLRAYTSALSVDLSTLEASISWLPEFSSDEPSLELEVNPRQTLPTAIEVILSNVRALNTGLRNQLQASVAGSSSDSPDPPLTVSHLRRPLFVANDALFRLDRATRQYLAHATRP